MVGHMMVMGNPKKRKRKARAMSALQRKYFGKRRGKKAAKKKRRVRSETIIVANSNPRRRSVSRKRRVRRRKSARRVIRARSNPRRSTRRRRFIRARRNPRILSGGVGGFISNSIVPAAIGAGGAIGLDYALNYLQPSLPQAMQGTGGQLLVRLGGALLIGMGVGAVGGNEAGEQAAAGGMIVTLYQLAQQYMQQQGNGQGNGNFYQGGQQGNGMNRYVPMRGMGNRNRRMGFIRRKRRLAAMRQRRMAGMGNGKPMRMRVGVPRLGFGPSAHSRMRNMRMGYIGPARTMGRYLQPAGR